MEKFPNVTVIKEKVTQAPTPVKVAGIVIASIICLAIVTATIVYLVNHFQGDCANSEEPAPDQIVRFKEKKAE